MASAVASGSHTISVVGNEETPTGATQSNPTQVLQVVVDTSALQAGEYVEIKVKKDVRAADTTRTESSRIVSWLEASGSAIIFMPPSMATGGEWTFTLRQIGGSARSFPWSVQTP